jgi:hypothetical protein
MGRQWRCNEVIGSLAAALLLACSNSSDDTAANNMPAVGNSAAGTTATGTAGVSAPPMSGNGAGTNAPPVAGTGAAGDSMMGAPPNASAGAGGMTSEAGAGGTATAGDGGGAGPGPGTPPEPAGPEGGDPSQPVVSIPDVACGGPMGGFGLGSANFQLDGRDMIVTYPCNKHAGAPVSFILNLHGTTPPELHFYQHAYFSAHQFAESHNLIVVTPSSVVQQWGNGDDGQDEPHLMNIIDWVYANLNGPGKFDIRAMWVGGHSWGGGYTARFGCKPELADKVKGLIMMSGGGVGGFGGAACADSVSVIISTAEGDMREPSDQMSLATSHGCDAAQVEMILNNKHTFWANCDPGFVHANYYMLGKEHADSMDREVVESIVDWIKIARQ